MQPSNQNSTSCDKNIPAHKAAKPIDLSQCEIRNKVGSLPILFEQDGYVRCAYLEANDWEEAGKMLEAIKKTAVLDHMADDCPGLRVGNSFVPAEGFAMNSADGYVHPDSSA